MGGAESSWGVRPHLMPSTVLQKGQEDGPCEGEKTLSADQKKGKKSPILVLGFTFEVNLLPFACSQELFEHRV